MEFVSASLPPTANGSTLTWSIGELPAKSGPATVWLTTTVKASDTIWHTAVLPVAIAASGSELEQENNQDQVSTHIAWPIFLPHVRKE